MRISCCRFKSGAGFVTFAEAVSVPQSVRVK